jgi:Uma2 family endonuclease
MAKMIHEPALERRLQRERAAWGADRYDEIWEGIYMMAPMPNHEHQRLVGRLTRVLDEIVTDRGLGDVVPGVNVSDRKVNWEQNYRVPDVAVFLKDTQAVNHDTFWLGGPDVAVEIVSPNDQSRQKLEFYGLVGTRELLIIDRDPWQLELYRHAQGHLNRVASVAASDGEKIASQVIPFELSLHAADDVTRIRVSDPQTGRSWTL